MSRYCDLQGTVLRNPSTGIPTVRSQISLILFSDTSPIPLHLSDISKLLLDRRMISFGGTVLYSSLPLAQPDYSWLCFLLPHTTMGPTANNHDRPMLNTFESKLLIRRPIAFMIPKPIDMILYPQGWQHVHRERVPPFNTMTPTCRRGLSIRVPTYTYTIPPGMIGYQLIFPHDHNGFLCRWISRPR